MCKMLTIKAHRYSPVKESIKKLDTTCKCFASRLKSKSIEVYRRSQNNNSSGMAAKKKKKKEYKDVAHSRYMGVVRAAQT